MKILVLVDSLKVGGGSDKVAAILGSELHDKGYDVSFLTLSDENPKYQFKGKYYTLGEKDIYGNNFKRIFKLLIYAPKVKRICQKLSIDIIISIGDPANFHALSSRLLGNKAKLIITQHMNPEIFQESKLRSNLIKFFYPRADKTVCVSREMEKILNENYGVHNTQTIYNMMDTDENIRLSREELPETNKNLMMGDKEQFNFINLGRLDHQKGQWFLIRSFRKVADKHENARLFILGEGDLRRDLKGLIKGLYLNSNVYFLGEQGNIFPYLANSNCFIMSSLWEGLPMSLIETLSLNVPIISTDCKTGPREILCPELELNEKLDYPYLGKYAILSQPLPNKEIFKDLESKPLLESEEQMSDLMIKMMEDHTLREKYSNGQEIARNFDKEKILMKWCALLEIILNKSQ